MKKPWSYTLVLLLLTVVLLSSCSITGRRYMPGYNIEWAGKSRKNVVQPQKVQASAEHKEFMPLSTVTDTKLATASIPIVTSKSSVYKNQMQLTAVQKSHLGIISKEQGIQRMPSILSQLIMEGGQQPTQSTNPGITLAKESLICGILSICLVVLSIIGIYLSVVLYGFLAIPDIVGTLFLITGAAAVVLGGAALFTGTKAIHALKDDPNLESYLSKAQIGTILGGLIFIPVVIGVIATIARNRK